ncbi:hypothetical protein [Thermoplasma volcanium]|uniref:hypothetical protein n=1 Tax=Thermoplasma volcanium TaxID=50339 RepID=UPI0000164E4C|nr:hypothetical protein [Thermoplasma volcanium]
MSLLSQLNNLSKITPEDIEVIQRLSKIAQRIQDLGLLDVIEGVLNDERTLGQIIALFTSDTVLDILNNRENLIKLIDVLSQAKTLENLTEILNKLS